MIILTDQDSDAAIEIEGTVYDLPTWAHFLTIDRDGDIDVHEVYPDRQFRGGYWDVPRSARRMPLCDSPPPRDWESEVYRLVPG